MLGKYYVLKIKWLPFKPEKPTTSIVRTVMYTTMDSAIE